MKIKCLLVLVPVFVVAAAGACKKQEPAQAGRIDAESGSFTLYPYDDAMDKGDSSIAIQRETLRNEKGEDETAWAFNGKVTTKFPYGYAGVVIIPDDKTLARLRADAETIKLRISGDGRRYRLSLDMENITDYNTFGTEITVPRRAEDIVIPVTSLKQEAWGIQAPFDRTQIKNLKIQTIGQPVPSFRFTLYRVEAQ
jgi:hypothetical protein